MPEPCTDRYVICMYCKNYNVHKLSLSGVEV